MGFQGNNKDKSTLKYGCILPQSNEHLTNILQHTQHKCKVQGLTGMLKYSLLLLWLTFNRRELAKDFNIYKSC